jgi:hypothetical protein
MAAFPLCSVQNDLEDVDVVATEDLHVLEDLPEDPLLAAEKARIDAAMKKSAKDATRRRKRTKSASSRPRTDRRSKTVT